MPLIPKRIVLVAGVPVALRALPVTLTDKETAQLISSGLADAITGDVSLPMSFRLSLVGAAAGIGAGAAAPAIADSAGGAGGQAGGSAGLSVSQPEVAAGAGQAGGAGTLSQAQPLQGAAGGAGAGSGGAGLPGDLAGSAAGQAGASATPIVNPGLSGTAAGAATGAGAPSQARPLVGSAGGVATGGAVPLINPSLVGSAGGTASVSATAPGVIGYDTFTGANNALLESHTPDIGSGWTKHTAAYASSMKIQSNRVYGNDDGSLSWGAQYYKGEALPATCTIEMDIYVVSTDACVLGIVARINTAVGNTYYMARANMATGGDCTWELYKVVSGSATRLGSWFDSTLAPGTTRHLTFQVSDSAKTVLVDGTQRITSADNAIASTYNRAGIQHYNADTMPTPATVGLHGDNFKITG